MKAANNQVVANVNNGIIISKIYYNWCKIKNDTDYKNWQVKAGSVRFGTYKTDSIFDVISNFDPQFPNEVIRADFLRELKDAYVINYNLNN